MANGKGEASFNALLDMIEIAVTEPVSESDYHNVVKCIRDYDDMRGNSEMLSAAEDIALCSRGWEKYNPFLKPIERIRFGMVFSATNNPRVAESIEANWGQKPPHCGGSCTKKS